MGYVMNFIETLDDRPEATDGHDRGHARHGHQAALDDGLDFVNTLENNSGGPTEHLPDIESAVRWFDEHQLLHRRMVDEQLRLYESDEAARERQMKRIRVLRGALRELLDATVEHRPASDEALREVNRALRTQYVYELVPAPDGCSLDHRHEGDPIRGALARLAESIARELTQPDVDRLRVCANEDCRWVFRDSSPAGRRKWCNMAVCGNRAKVARHRERKKAEAAGAADVSG
jgi:predicted RNA-binding Zn ribbon-like protein